MAVIHIYLKHGNVSCTTKEPFIGKEKRLLKFPSWTELFSNNISSVVFKLPSLLKTGNPKIICFGLLSFMLGKYYKQRVPKRLDSFLDSQEDKNLFFIGGSVGAQIVEFHYARKGDVIIEGTETINLIAKNNKTLNRSLSQIQPTKIKKRIFIVGLFSFDLLCYLRKKYPLADMELRYFDILPENKINDFIRIKDFSFANNIKLSVYDRATSSRFQLPYEMSKVNTSKLINFLNKNTSNLLSRDIKENSGSTPYLCASAENNGVSSFISYDDPSFLNRGNCVFIGGKTFVVSYQEKDFFSNDSHNLALYLKEKKYSHKDILLGLATCINLSLRHRYSWGNSISSQKIKHDFVTLPLNNGQPDFETLGHLTSALKKLVLKSVNDFVTEKTSKLITQ